MANKLGVVKHVSDRVAVMYLGRIAELADRRALFHQQEHPYTQALMSAIPIPNPELRRQRVILKGDVPSPVNPPSGCRFHTRCWLYERLGQPENCRTDDPELISVAGVDAHRAACHYADEALKTDVGIAHIGDVLARRGTPASALASLAEGNGAAVHAEDLAAPAFADLSPLATEIETTEGLSEEDPSAIDTPSSRTEGQQRHP